MFYGVLALVHVGRSFIGFGMGRVVPSSYDFVEKLEFKGDKQLHFPQVRPALTRKVQNLLLEYYDDFEIVARLYFFLALATTVLDVIAFFVVFGMLASYTGDGPEDIEASGEVEAFIVTTEITELYLTGASIYLGRILVVAVYTVCDLVYVLWILHFKSRMGETERGYTLKALLGFGDGMRIAFGHNPKGNAKGQAPGAR